MIEDFTKQFWSAAFFYRRAPDRDRNKAVAVLTRLSGFATGKVLDRATKLLKEIEHGTNANTSGTGRT